MDDNDEKDIIIATTLSYDEFLAQHLEMNRAMILHGIDFDLSAATVIRTWLASRYGSWFEERKADWSDFFFMADGGNCGCFTRSASDVETDIDIVWNFSRWDRTNKALAMLFKLTWGGK